LPRLDLSSEEAAERQGSSQLGVADIILGSTLSSHTKID
jgi:hypothetical protein